MLRVAIASLTLCVILSVSIPSAFATNVVMTGGSISATLIDSSYTLIGPNFLAQGGSELTGNGLSSTNFAPGGLLTENTFVNMSFPGDLIIADGVSGNHNGFFPNVLSNYNNDPFPYYDSNGFPIYDSGGSLNFWNDGCHAITFEPDYDFNG